MAGSTVLHWSPWSWSCNGPFLWIVMLARMPAPMFRCSRCSLPIDSSEEFEACIRFFNRFWFQIYEWLVHKSYPIARETDYRLIEKPVSESMNKSFVVPNIPHILFTISNYTFCFVYKFAVKKKKERITSLLYKCVKNYTWYTEWKMKILYLCFTDLHDWI